MLDIKTEGGGGGGAQIGMNSYYTTKRSYNLVCEIGKLMGEGGRGEERTDKYA